MIGEGPARENAERLCVQLGIQDRVVFLGNSNEVNKILCFSDLFQLPSETESFGLVALEAMASKTAVISTNSGGISEVNIEGKTGFLSNVGDVDKMSEDILILLKDPEFLERLKMNALAHAKSFSLENVLPQYNAIYQTLCCTINNK
jgi:glycosyltransferase involved in cell wall biosynthesis